MHGWNYLVSGIHTYKYLNIRWIVSTLHVTYMRTYAGESSRCRIVHFRYVCFKPQCQARNLAPPALWTPPQINNPTSISSYPSLALQFLSPINSILYLQPKGNSISMTTYLPSPLTRVSRPTYVSTYNSTTQLIDDLRFRNFQADPTPQHPTTDHRPP